MSMETATATTEQNLTQAYETKTCGRCGGSGHYSYCQMYGTTCFGCSGKGKVYTKRGMAALDYGKTLRTIKVKDVQVGMLLYVNNAGCPFGGKSGWFTVTKSEMTDQCCTSKIDGVETKAYYWNLETSQGGMFTFPESDVQCVTNKARLLEVKALALAYQATLGVTGKPARRAKKQ